MRALTAHSCRSKQPRVQHRIVTEAAIHHRRSISYEPRLAVLDLSDDRSECAIGVGSPDAWREDRQAGCLCRFISTIRSLGILGYAPRARGHKKRN
jgi:hypothetical protein